MDTGDYETNALVINNISSVAFAFYEPVPPTSTSLGSSATEIENVLRKDGHLTYVDHARHGLWCFRLLQKGKIQGHQPPTQGFARTAEGGGHTMCLNEEGAFEPAALVKNRPHGLGGANTPSSSSSSASSALDPAFKSAQSAFAPSFPHAAADQESKACAPTDLRPSPTASIKDVHECLVLAAFSTIFAVFCARTGAVPLSSRTLLLTRPTQTECSAFPAVLASLRVYLTTTGSLVVTLSHSYAENLVNLSETLTSHLPPLGVTVLAAPFGVFATCQPITMTETTTTEGSLGQSPDTQVLRIRTERDDGPWRTISSKLLQSRHIPYSFGGPQKWIGLHRIRRKLSEQSVDGKGTPMVGNVSSLSWPANLCFCKMFSKLAINAATENVQQPQTDPCFDPLKIAKNWFLNATERDEALASKQRERNAAAAAAAAVAHENAVPDGQAQIATGLSPLALRRSSHNNGPPPSGMYPTPPDAVQGIVGVTPSMDGNMSSPGYHATTMAMVDVGNTTLVPAEQYGENWDNAEVKREHAGSSFESENLFGELGPDMFGDNDITEADFSFFDEDPGGLDLGSLNIPDMPTAGTSISLEAGFGVGQDSRIKPDPHFMPLTGAPASPVFTKPELRHARSSLPDDGRRQTVPETTQAVGLGAKRPASPFNPDTVYKRIRASLDNHRAIQQNSQIYASQPGSIFDKVDFGPGLSMVNSKYEGSGRFDYSMDRSKATKPSNPNAPPTTNYLKRHGKGQKGLKELPSMVGGLFSRVYGNQDSASNRHSPLAFDEPHSDADEVSLVSDQDDSTYDSDEPMSPVKSSSMRRCRDNDDGESLATSFRGLETMDMTLPYLTLGLPRSSKSEIELPLVKYFADPEPPWIQYSLPDDQLIMVAQILTDQFAASTFSASISAQMFPQSKVDRRRQLSSVARHSMQELRATLPSCFGSAVECQFRPFIEVQDVPLLGQPTRMQPRPPGVDQMRPSNLFQIPSPHFEMRRYESRLSVLPSAVSFWESLGLSPSQGNKDINAICIFPDYEGMADDMLVFTDRMRSTYESLKLGSFNRLPTTTTSDNGLFTFDVEKDVVSFGKSASFLGPSLQSCASKVCKVVSASMAEHTNFVIFFVYSPDVAGSIVECCAVFNEIFEGYKRFLANRNLPLINDLALQLIPQDFVASSTSVAMPPPMEFARLALETYDRCNQSGGGMPSPAIVLEQPPPRMIDFKLSANPSASLLYENTCLHVAYAQSIDDRWVTAAWTNNRGSQQMTASYCLGRKGKSIVTPLADVAAEIWATTRDLISAWKVHWRIIIAKCGAMDPHEIELWSTLAQSESKPSVNLTLVAVDTDPSLQLVPPIAKVPNNASGVFYTTPVSTPQNSMVSPEHTGNPSTPMRDNAATSTPGGDNNATDSDADATLTDLTDQTWGAVLSHRLNNSTSLTELNPALTSGYLVKRGGARIDDPPVVMEVNIVHSEGNPRAYEALLREMLTYYRGLGTLARARGMVDKEADVRPWHVAAAEKGVRALYMLM